MGKIAYQHQMLADGKWASLPVAEQLANIGSEVSRALRWQNKNEARMNASLERALELLDLSISSGNSGELRELCRAREELCDYFMGSNTFKTTPDKLMRYYDQFALVNLV